MIDVVNVHQFATQFQAHGMAAHHRMRGIFPHVKKGKKGQQQGRPAPTQPVAESEGGPLSPPQFSPAPKGTPVQGELGINVPKAAPKQEELGLDWGAPKPAAPKSNVVQGKLDLDWGNPKPSTVSSNPLNFTSSWGDHPMNAGVPHVSEPHQGEFGLDFGTPKPAAPSPAQNFTSSFNDHPMYDAGGDHAASRARMSQTSANARAFQGQVESRIAAFKNQRR